MRESAIRIRLSDTFSNFPAHPLYQMADFADGCIATRRMYNIERSSASTEGLSELLLGFLAANFFPEPRTTLSDFEMPMDL